MLLLLITVILVALVFEICNAFHDCANACSTVVSTGVLPLKTAIIISAIFNLIGALTGTAVAKTIATGFADPLIVTQYVIISALLGAIIWNLITWYFGIPSSSSHALIGGLAGAVTSHAGFSAFKWKALTQKILVPLVISPTIGFFAAMVLMILCLWLFKKFKPSTVSSLSKKLQLLSSCMMSFSHGSGDSQKVMGIIVLALMTAGSIVPSYLLPKNGQVPLWVIILCAVTMGLGTLIGGKKIIKTMGCKIIKINPLQGFVAETTGALTILAAAKFGIPVSTTHCINASIMGVGASKRASAVRWGVAGNILMAWIFTLPISGLISFIIMKVFP